MWVLESNQDWVEGHARFDEKTERWICNETGAEIQQVTVGRSIWISEAPGRCTGDGEVRSVAHAYCPTCQPEFEAPKPGTPVYDNQLIELA